MTCEPGVVVTLPADVQQVDETGYVWAHLDDSPRPDRVYPHAHIVAGDPVEPFVARVVDVMAGPGRPTLVHLEVVGIPDALIDELRHAGLIAP